MSYRQGRPRAYGKRKRISLWLEVEMLNDLVAAKSEGESLNHYIVRCLEYAQKHSPFDFLDDETKRRLSQEARDHNQPMTTTVRQILQDYFKTQNEREKTEKTKEKYADFFNDLQNLTPNYYSFTDLAKLANKYFLDDQTHKRMIAQAVEKRIIQQLSDGRYAFQTFKLCPYYHDEKCKIKEANKLEEGKCDKLDPQTCWMIELLKEARAQGATRPTPEQKT